MHTQEMDRTIKRACRNTIGDAIRRSTGHNSEKDALIFGERRWSYAGLDAGANRTKTAERNGERDTDRREPAVG
jgi:fatty-acyl-CoA synthase